MNRGSGFSGPAALLASVLLATPAAADTLSLPDVRAEDFPLDIATPPGPNFDPVPPDRFLQRIAEISDWIVAHSDYPPGLAPPVTVLLPRATLNYVFYSQMVGGYRGQDCINALYLPHVLLLADDLAETECSDTLVHELVHHFQFVTGRAFRCTAEAEREAYELQAQWTRETGVGMLPSPLFLRRLTCDNPHEWGVGQ
jgi:hypothetical protein